MQKSFLTKVKLLLITVLTAGAIWSCQDEKPVIIVPENPGPVIPQKEFKHVETITPDTLTFNEGDSAVFQIRTIPYNLLSRDSLTIQIADTAGAKYGFAEIKSYKMGSDSVWSIVMHVTYGMETGDVISIMVADKDTVIYSDQTVLNMIPKPVEPVIEYGVSIINADTVAAFIAGGNANLRIKTAPWNLLFADSLFSITLADSTGAAVDDKFRLAGVAFNPKDSTWNATVNILSSVLTSDYLSVNLVCPDTVILSNPVNVLKVSISMSSVKLSVSKSMAFDGKMTYSFLLPTVTDFSGQKFRFKHDGDKITCGDSVLVEDDYNTLDANKPITVSVWKYDAHRDYILKMYNTGLPVVRIETNGQNITSRKDWYEGISMRIEYPDGTVDYEGTLSMRGRGNGTWVENGNWGTPPKKPYALRLDEKAKILGMHKHKRWILLANYKDRTLLRNDAAYWLSRQTDLPYTIHGQYVELVWNGVHKGNYYLCEQAKIDNHRIDIPDPDLENPQNGGIFLEIDTYYNYYVNDRQYPKKEELGFTSNSFRIPYIFKEPDESMINTTSATYKYVTNYINNLEGIIMNDTKLKNRDYLQYLDIDKAIDFLLIQELTMNNDSYNTWPSNGPHSTFLYIDSIGKLCFGPVWDFDYHTFTLKDERGNTSSRLEQWELLSLSSKGVNNQHYYFDRLKGDPEFKRRLIDRWDMHKGKFKQLPTYIRTMADSIRLSESENYKVWGAINNPNGNQNGDQTLSFDQAIENMIQAFNKRWDWIELKIGYYRNDINYH